MLFFEFVPAFIMLVCLCAGIWLVAMDHRARTQPAEERTRELSRPRPRS